MYQADTRHRRGQKQQKAVRGFCKTHDTDTNTSTSNLGSWVLVWKPPGNFLGVVLHDVGWLGWCSEPFFALPAVKQLWRVDPLHFGGVQPPVGSQYFFTGSSVLRVRTGKSPCFFFFGRLPVSSLQLMSGRIFRFYWGKKQGYGSGAQWLWGLRGLSSRKGGNDLTKQ